MATARTEHDLLGDARSPPVRSTASARTGPSRIFPSRDAPSTATSCMPSAQ